MDDPAILETGDALKRDISLMDAGMSNNIPFYPLLRPGRDVDIIVIADSSSDVDRWGLEWLRRAACYARRKHLDFWPENVGWTGASSEQTGGSQDTCCPEPEEKLTKSPSSVGASSGLEPLRNALKKALPEFLQKSGDKASNGKSDSTGSRMPRRQPEDAEPSRITTTSRPQLCEIYTGRDTGSGASFRNGLVVAYYPMLPNANHPTDPKFDPASASFCATYRIQYTAEQFEKILALGNVNFTDGLERLREKVKTAWEKKRDNRLASEK